MMRNKLKISALILGLGCISTASAQDPNGSGQRYEYGDPISRIERGTTVAIRTSENIDARRNDNRVYLGTVDQDVRAGNGRVAIPRGSQVELMVRVASDNSLILDLESVTVGDQRYAIDTDANRVQSETNESPLVAAIIGAVSGGQASGRSVRARRGTVLRFRLERSLDVGVADRGETRAGRHYHEYYRQQ